MSIFLFRRINTEYSLHIITDYFCNIDAKYFLGGANLSLNTI